MTAMDCYVIHMNYHGFVTTDVDYYWLIQITMDCYGLLRVTMEFIWNTNDYYGLLGITFFCGNPTERTEYDPFSAIWQGLWRLRFYKDCSEHVLRFCLDV